MNLLNKPSQHTLLTSPTNLCQVTARHDRQLAELAANQLAALTAQKEEFIRITQEQQQLQGGKSAELANALSARDQGRPLSPSLLNYHPNVSCNQHYALFHLNPRVVSCCVMYS